LDRSPLSWRSVITRHGSSSAPPHSCFSSWQNPSRRDVPGSDAEGGVLQS
jgi:hypothetical protein